MGLLCFRSSGWRVSRISRVSKLDGVIWQGFLQAVPVRGYWSYRRKLSHMDTGFRAGEAIRPW